MANMWDALVNLAGMLYRREVDLDDLNAEKEKRESEESAGKHVDENQIIPNPVAEKKPTKLVIEYNKEEEAICINYTKRIRVDEEAPPKNKRSRVRVRVQQEQGKTELLLTQEIRNKILDFGGKEESLAFVIEKKLYKSDVDQIQNRFSIPRGKVNGQFVDKLLPTEVARLKSGVPVTLFGFGGKKHTLSLREWKTNGSHVLVGGWYDKICLRYGLKEHQLVQLWCFRRNDSDLSFALLRATKKKQSLSCAN